MLKSDQIEDIELDIDDDDELKQAKEIDKKLEDIVRDCGGEPYVGDNLLEYKEKKLKSMIIN